MLACEINRNSHRYQKLKTMSGISEFSLDNTISRFQTEFNRMPELDELPNVNSEPYFKEALDIKEMSTLNAVDTNKILLYTSTQNIQEANILLNNLYKDLEITLTLFDTFTAADIQHRPRINGKIADKIELELDLNPLKNRIIITDSLNKLAKLYGINIIPVSTDEIKDIPNAGVVKGFVHDGNIYVNTDNSTLDTPIHELMHIFLGGMRYTDPLLYFSLLRTVELLPNYENLLLPFSFKTRGDANEEIFVQEYAKYLTNQASLFDKLDVSLLSKITYEVLRNLDSFISGEYSIKTFNGDIFSSTLKSLMTKLQSNKLNNKLEGSLDVGTIHRMLANYKEDLKRNNLLEERCDG